MSEKPSTQKQVRYCFICGQKKLDDWEVMGYEEVLGEIWRCSQCKEEGKAGDVHETQKECSNMPGIQRAFSGPLPVNPRIQHVLEPGSLPAFMTK